ncbi:unnamed protein product [Blepharisma stoltei]|uniref:Uncharacterized protein n=1 Tax=Blepharisma stoltei TaxID=1481888 RepID=A0AAU9JQ92_9CILI|nr:unnamed protein product [Blepharisma stoltei]
MKFAILLGIIVQAAIELNTNIGLEKTDDDYQKFESNLQVYDENYKIACDCSDVAVKKIEGVKCHPSKIKLSQDKEGEGASYETVSEKLSSKNFTYVKSSKNSFGCLDGRINREILGTPGGDAGEFILALLVFEDITEKSLDQDDVDRYLEDWLSLMDSEHFYMCTDDYSISHIERELSVEGLDIMNPRKTLIDDLLDVISDPNNIGDSHIKLMLEYPELYSIRPNVIQLFIKAFYKILWDEANILRNYLFLDVLSGSHNEVGFLEIRTNQECLSDEVAPLITPKEPGKHGLSLFVNHLDAVNIKRRRLAEFFAEKIAKNKDGITIEKMHSRMNHHGLFFLDITGSYIAKELPFYTAFFV